MDSDKEIGVETSFEAFLPGAENDAEKKSSSKATPYDEIEVTSFRDVSFYDGNAEETGEDDIGFDDFPDDRDFTWRAALLGSCVGGLIAISNIYLGLKVGITQGASLFAVMIGGVVMRPILLFMKKYNDSVKLLGPKEHCCFQSAATSAGGLNGGLTSAVIGLFWIAQDPKVPDEDKGRPWYGTAADNAANVILLVFSAVAFGVFLGVPFRRYFIEIQKLTFPDGFASASLIKTIYKKGQDEKAIRIAKQQGKMILIFSTIGFFAVLLQNFVPIVFKWPIFQFLSSCGGGQSVDDCLATPPQSASTTTPPTENNLVYSYWALAALWGWCVSWDPVMVGTAFIVPQRVNCWFFIGAVLCFGIIGPACMTAHEYPDSYNYSQGKSYIFKNTLLWPAVFVVLASSISDVIFEWRQFKGLFVKPKKEKTESDEVKEDVPFLERIKKDIVFTFTSSYSLGNIDRSKEKTPFIIWMFPLLGLAVASWIIMCVQFSVLWYQVLITYIFICILVVIYLQILGATNWGLISLMGKIVVITLGLAGGSLSSILACGNMVAQTMSQIGDITQCYKTGYMIKASPHAQFSANVVGNLFGILFTVGGFFIFTIAFPCITEYPTPTTCAFEVPSTNAWYSLAKAIIAGFSIGTGVNDNMTPSGLWISVGMSIIAVISNGFKFYTKTKHPETFKKYSFLFPLWSVLLIPFLVSAEYAVATVLGGLVRFIWCKANESSEKNFKYQVGSGLVCGGALGGSVYALVRIAGVTNDDVVLWGF